MKNDYDLTMQDKIRYRAELVMRFFQENLGVSLGYDGRSVAQVDRYIEENRKGLQSSTTESLISILGSFLGECIRHQFGGNWHEINGTWAIRFDDKNMAFPFAKVEKQFHRGHSDSVYSFYNSIPLIFNLRNKPQSSLKEGTDDNS
jgi:hypothetical protein